MPSALRVHGALILVQCIFGGGAVVGKLGVHAFNPLVFALIREAAAGILLSLWALFCDGRQHLRQRGDAWLFVASGVCVFFNQACFILGDKLAGAVIASAWQPIQPVLTLLIALMLGWERLTMGKAAGVLVSFAGAAFMVLYKADLNNRSSLGTVFAGNILFFFNCLGTSLYVIVCKVVLSRGYPPSTVTAWSYLSGATMMLGTASALSSSCPVVQFLCPPSALHPHPTGGVQCDGLPTSCEPWAVPSSAVLPLTYWVLMNSCVAYWLMTWANQHTQAGFVLAYCALQPLVSSLVSVAIVSSGMHSDLQMPGWNALGGIPIVIGLVLILRDGQRHHGNESKASLLLPPAALVNPSDAAPGRARRDGSSPTVDHEVDGATYVAYDHATTVGDAGSRGSGPAPRTEADEVNAPLIERSAYRQRRAAPTPDNTDT